MAGELTHIVTLGGGTGQATLLQGLRSLPCRVTALVGVTDNGGHSGQLRRTLRIPQVGDIRQCLRALQDDQSIWSSLLEYRFTRGDLCGLSVGNLMLAALTEMSGSLQTAVEQICQAAGIAQQVLPVSDGDTHIGAELEDGRVLIGEWEIIQRRPRSAITRLFLQPVVPAHEAVLHALADADVVVICPGSLLTGILAALLPTGIREELLQSRARCIYVGNLMTQPGQTDGWSAGQHLAQLHGYLGRPVDAVLLNDGSLPAALLRQYAAHGSYPVHDDLSHTSLPVFRADLVEHPTDEAIRAYTRSQPEGMQVGLHLIRHDAAKLAAEIFKLASTDR